MMVVAGQRYFLKLRRHAKLSSNIEIPSLLLLSNWSGDEISAVMDDSILGL
jgi:hypothetical protein